ncbi:cadherin-like domain-containing protein [Hymenobacter terrenus]|uniref:cadherin-like domain-containing protein n=1 Tax=Hymenobacter terrenus TaxID=1629124 RepID=UPI0018CD7A1B|nr:Ig-like domain-containing protein [Hymenobacter terrenus]
MKQMFTPALLLAGSLLLSLMGYARQLPFPHATPQEKRASTSQGTVRPAPYRGHQAASSSPATGSLLARLGKAARQPSHPALLSTGMTATPLRADSSVEQVTQEWVARHYQPVPARTASLQLARDVTVDLAGNVFVTGLSATFSGDLLTIKYSPTGQQVWARYAGLRVVSTYGMAVGVDAAGNAYVAAEGVGGTVILKYSPGGVQQWTVQTNARLYSLKVDAAGNVYVTGDSQNDYLTVKYSTTGQQLWAARYSSPDSNGDYAQRLDLDAAGNVYVTGISYRAGMANSSEFATIKYSPTGQQLWVARYNTPGNTYNEGRIIAVDPAGNAYVSGYIQYEDGTTASGYVTVKYSPSGQQLWTASGGVYPTATALDAAGNVFVSGYSFLTGNSITTKYSSGGQQLWTNQSPSIGSDSFSDLEVDAAGNAYVTGTVAKDYATVKYSPAGQQLWEARYNGPVGNGADNGIALALDPAGNLYVTGDSEDADFSTDFVTIKYSQSSPSACTNSTVNQPVASADRLTVGAGPLTIAPAQLLANDSDPLGRALQVASVGSPSSGTLVRNANGTFTYTPRPGFVGTATFTYLLQEAGPVLASPGTGHYYEFVSGPGICWADARAAAAARRYQGMAGYLTTITSVGEKDFLVGRAPGAYWFGASDTGVEGEWRWQTGPEAGQLFWRGGANGIGAAYSHWLPNQPDDYKNQWRPQGEDYGQLYGHSGLWNDVDNCNTGGNTAGYVVEYGGLEPCVPILYSTGRVTLEVGSSPQTQRATARSTSLVTTGPTLLQASPNPSVGQFRVQVLAGSEGPAQLDLFDLQGRRVRSLFTGQLHTGEQREVPVEAQELSAGIYLVRLQSGQQVQHLRVSIQK